MKTKLLILTIMFAFQIQAQNIVEIIGNKYNKDCQKIAESVNQVKHIYDLEPIMLTYYSSDPNQTDDSKARAKYYGIIDHYPSFIVNGNRFWLTVCEDTAAYIEQCIDRSLIDQSLVMQFVNRTNTGYPTGFYHLTIYVRGSTERNIVIHTCLTDGFNLLKMHPTHEGIVSDMSQLNDSEIIDFMFQSGDKWDLEKLRIIVFVQDMDNNKIISSKAANINDIRIMGIEKMESEKINLFPNPVIDIINFKGQYNEVVIFDQLSRIYYKGPETEIDLSRLSTGLYFARLDNKVTMKFIKK